MKNILLISTLVLYVTVQNATAQNAHEARVTFNKESVSAVVADYNNSEDVIKQVLRKRLEKEGLKKMKSTKGFMVYSGVIWNPISSNKMDYYFEVDGNKRKATISVLLSTGYNNFLTSGNDANAIQNVKSFLNGLTNDIAAYQRELDIEAQKVAVEKAEEHKRKIADRQAKLEKRQAEKHKALEEEKRKLENIKASK